MKYVEFKESIQNSLLENPDGLTWQELKNGLKLPYKILCQTWIYQLEEEINLVRSLGNGNVFI